MKGNFGFEMAEINSNDKVTYINIVSPHDFTVSLVMFDAFTTP